MFTEKFAVIGHPIEHSKSPVIHQAFASQFGKSISYEKLLSPLDGFSETLNRLHLEGYRGVNITVPFKFEAYEASHTLSDRATAAGAVNTLSFKDQQIIGDNTDGCGLVNDILKHWHRTIEGKQILLLGAGGAAQGVILPLLAQKPALLTVANRSLDKARTMVERFEAGAKSNQVKLAVQTFDNLAENYDIVINATSAGLQAEALPIKDVVFAHHTLAYDMMYGRETPFMQQARAAEAQVADGLGMLVEQAAEAFYIWHGLRPDTASVIQSFRQT
ncbi:MAG: shikimate dehydrogenase [Methylophilus sp.]|uniref:shikimate dehydrogenase n=1 Tax=Methylophilus sp. TaxID=29541 RepID=UPI002B8434DE|nr:shikimate dehydrogenase [Methylophilus sp.]HSH88190.1 shikimate dehydrogenase [Methylophilus sp.]